MIYDCLIIGGGPAGLSAAIYLARYNRTCLVVDHNRGRWRSHEINENYLGFPTGIRARRLRELGRKQALRFGAALTVSKVTRINEEGDIFVARAARRTFEGRTVILATGVRDILPDIGDTADYWGKTLFWCITCDGHKIKGAPTVIVGRTDTAAISCLQFLAFTDKLFFVTNCTSEECELTKDGRARLKHRRIPIYESPIDHVEGVEGVMETVVLKDGTRLEAKFMFNEQGCVPRVELAEALGVRLADNGFIATDDEQRTNIPFVYAAGDVTKEFAHQIVTAAHEGATAGITANYDLYEPDQRV
ncbi:MAG: NAD(P)/FAD-dependent oxidoreductase [Chloroflexota bacterium]|nr:NAD(P)/FAD-dependent oxidoreductase [Chloroflexota bacterium]